MKNSFTPYGRLPKELGLFHVDCPEMMFYQYLPIKMADNGLIRYEARLQCFTDLINECINDFIAITKSEAYNGCYIYLTAKRLFQMPNCSFNRQGYHSDGFMTKDYNYIWCDNTPTVFNSSPFLLTMDDKISMVQMKHQALPENEVTYPVNTLLRLNQFNIHKVADTNEIGMRTFFKLSFSKDKYDLLGNSHNYLLDYDWTMKQRQVERNIPQSIVK